MVVEVVAGKASAFVVASVAVVAVEVVVDVAVVPVLILAAAAAAVLVVWLLVLHLVPCSRFLALVSLGHHHCYC